jgi:hypothetical protein
MTSTSSDLCTDILITTVRFSTVPYVLAESPDAPPALFWGIDPRTGLCTFVNVYRQEKPVCKTYLL